MPILRVVETVKLTANDRLCVVRQNGEQTVILSLVEEDKPVTRRTAINLSLANAKRLALALEGLSCTYDKEDAG